MFTKSFRINALFVLMLLLGMVVFSTCAEFEPFEPVEEEPVVEVQEEPLAEEEQVVEEEPMAEEEQVVEEEPLAEEEGIAEEEMIAATFPIRASELLGDDVMTRANEDLGQVEEIILSRNKQTDYAIIEFEDGFLDLGVDEMTAIPLSALEPAAEEDAFYYTGQEATIMQDAPVFTEDAWGDLTNPAWDDDFFNFWSGQEEFAAMAEMGQESAVDGPAFIRVSELLDEEVWTPTDEDIGDVEDIVLQNQADSQDFAIMSFDENLFDLGAEDLYAVPVSELNFVTEGDNLFTFDRDPALLSQAPSFTADAWPDITNPTWDEQYVTYWEEQEIAAE